MQSSRISNSRFHPRIRCACNKIVHFYMKTISNSFKNFMTSIVKAGAGWLTRLKINFTRWMVMKLGNCWMRAYLLQIKRSRILWISRSNDNKFKCHHFKSILRKRTCLKITQLDKNKTVWHLRSRRAPRCKSSQGEKPGMSFINCQMSSINWPSTVVLYRIIRRWKRRRKWALLPTALISPT